MERRPTAKCDEKKRLALKLCLEGLGFRAIGKVLDINFMNVYYWIKKWRDSVSLPSSESSVEIVELDELHSYVQNKKTTVGFGLLLIDLEKVHRFCLWEKRYSNIFKTLDQTVESGN